MRKGTKKNSWTGKKFVLGIMVGVGISLAIFLSFHLWLFLSQQKKNDPSVVAPYYEPKVFQKPADLQKPKSASESAVISEEVKIRLPIIMYHYVEYVKDQGDIIRKRLDINPYVFENQLRTLYDDGYHTYFVKDVPDILADKIVPAEKSVILTFDDGYEDFYYDVFPLLKRYQMKATIFVINDFIGRKGFLNESEIKEVIGSGLVELGSHTLDHLYLKLVPKTIAEKQILESKKKLEEKFGIEVKSFAYPYGAFNKETVELVKDAKYSVAVSVISGVEQSKENLFYLSRVRAGALSGLNMLGVLEHYKN